MRIIKKKTNIDFIGKRRPALFISSVLNLAILVGITIFGFNFGVDFAGGTVVELKFDHRVTAEDIRKRASPPRTFASEPRALAFMTFRFRGLEAPPRTPFSFGWAE